MQIGLVTGLFAATAKAGTNADGKLLLHVNESIQWTTSQTYEGQSGLDDPFHAKVDVSGTGPWVFFVLLGFPEESEPDVRGLTFGITYADSLFGLLDYGTSADFALPTESWPEPNEGIALTWSESLRSTLFEVYWFAGYTDSAIPTLFELTPHPTQGGKIGDDSGGLDDITGYGKMGFNTYGYNPFVTTEAPDSLIVSFLVMPDSTLFSLPREDGSPISIRSTSLLSQSLRDTLWAYDATAIEKSFPGKTRADTLGYDMTGRIVHLPDLSRFYRVDLGSIDSLTAVAAASAISHVPGVLQAEAIGPTSEFYNTVNDPYFEEWGSIHEDIQWNLQNDGERSDPDCSHASAGEDLDLQNLDYWYEANGNPDVAIIILDTGILDDHEDLNVIAHYGFWADSVDFCGSHGTKMAGIAAAQTNNLTGIAGVCPDCSVVDLMATMPGVDPDDCGADWDAPFDPRWDTYLVQAIDGTLESGKWIAAVNISASLWSHAPGMAAMYYASQLGIAVVMAAGNNPSTEPVTNIFDPLVFGIGGHTWAGEFWEPATDCYADEEIPHGTPPGYSHVDITAPASGSGLSAHCEPVGGLYYAPTRIMTSGATAQTSGAIGLLQAMALDSTGSFLPLPLILSVLQGSARDFSIDPTDEGIPPTCATCTRADYGPGMLDVGSAVALSDSLSTTDLHFVETVVDIGSPGHTLTSREYTVEGVTWNEYKLEVPVVIPAHNLPWLQQPRIAYARSIYHHTNTAFKLPNDTWEISGSVAECGVRGCTISPIDQEDGSCSIVGYMYSYEVGEEEIWVTASPGVARMAYWYLSDVAVDVPEFETPRETSHIAMSLPSNPMNVPGEVIVDVPSDGFVELGVYDAGGRNVSTLVNDILEKGRYRFRLENLASGVYWLRIWAPGTSQAEKLVVLR